MNPRQVSGVVIAVVVAFMRKRRLDGNASDQSVSREYLESNVLFYFSAAFLLGLLWNWIGVQWSDPVHSSKLLWVFIDVTLPVLLGATAVQLLREASAEAG